MPGCGGWPRRRGRRQCRIMFDKETYVRRRRILKEKMGVAGPEGRRGVALFLGNAEAPAQYRDNAYAFRQDSTWLYLFGIDAPGYAAIIDFDSAEETIYADDPDMDDIIWTGPLPSVREVAAKAGVSRSAPAKALDAAISAVRAAGRPVHFIPASRYHTALRLSELLGVAPREMFSSGKRGCAKASRPLVEAIVSMRLVKEDVEIASIEEACRLGQQMHRLGRSLITVGSVERDACGAMEGLAKSVGWGLSFATILTQHGEIFHNHGHDAVIAPGRMLVIDAGVEAGDHYASDFTRTYPTGGKFTSKQRDIYQIVCDCNEHAFSLIRPGVAYRDVHVAVERMMLERLSDLGLLRGNVDDMVSEGVAGLFMPHGLGHNMGLDVHDMEDFGEDLVGYDPDQERSPRLGLGSLRMARRLVPGNVVTDEPGIYFIPALIGQWRVEGKAAGFVNYDKLEAYYDFGGIRLEDDVLVTEDGARRLGPDRLEIAPDDVEQAMKQ